MNIFLSKEELEREMTLFLPLEEAYPLDREVLDIAAFKEQVVQGGDVQEAPLSC
jgi:hypothetical protein